MGVKLFYTATEHGLRVEKKGKFDIYVKDIRVEKERFVEMHVKVNGKVESNGRLGEMKERKNIGKVGYIKYAKEGKK